MGLWGVTPVLVTALLGAGAGSHPALVHHVADHSAVPAVSSSPNPVLSMTPAVLRQISADQWQTTVLVDDITGDCRTGQPEEIDYSLETTGPAKTETPTSLTSVILQHSDVVAATARSLKSISLTHRAVTASAVSATVPAPAEVACEVTLDFAGLAQVPSSATLVLDGSSSLQLTVSRDVTLSDYLAIPAIVGAGMALLLLILSLGLVRARDPGGRRKKPGSSKFWNHPVSATGAWTVNDSWATNITAAVAAIGSIYGITTAANSIFPGVALDRFAILIAFAGGITTAAPLFFGIMYSLWTGHHSGAPIDSTIRLPGGKNPGGPASIWTSAGAAITVPGGATAHGRVGSAQREVRVEAGQTIQIPMGSHIEIRATAIALPGGSDVIVPDESELLITNDDYPASANFAAHGHGEVSLEFPLHMEVPGGAKITVVGGAHVALPGGAEILKADGVPYVLPKDGSHFRLPQGTNMLTGTLGMVILAALVTIFGIGAEIGIGAVLAIQMSDASTAGHWGAAAIAVAIGIFTLCYSVTAIRALVDSQPGSSLSSTDGTSFTL
jgi:hypothetical protein